MHKTTKVAAIWMVVSAGVAVGQNAAPKQNGAVKVDPAKMARIGSVDERFQSYNIEMVEVTGGRFWKPYASVDAAKEKAPKDSNANQPAGMDPSLYEYRPPIDLSNARLRKLAAALGPMYVRVSGTWANSTYFDPHAQGEAGAAPEGFKGVLTGKEWKGVVDFVKASNAQLVTSFATSVGTRDSAGVWTPKEAEKLVEFTKSAGGHIAAAELMNEPTFAAIGGAPKGYDAAAFARDVVVFRTFAKKDAPGMLVLGPGGVTEGVPLLGMESGQAAMPMPNMLASADLLKATGPVFDAFSYHSYASVSTRCNPKKSTDLMAALSEDALGRATRIAQFYGGLRDTYEPGKPMWNTETAEAACGGDRWAAQFVDIFRYLGQLGDLARLGVQVNMYNTLAASDYGLLDEKSYAPRPNYWAALLWHRLMGATVLDAGEAKGLRVYAQCLREHPGGVAMLAINTRREAQEIDVPMEGVRYTLTAKALDDGLVMLNGMTLELSSGDALPAMDGAAFKAGRLTLEPESITFAAFARAGNGSCQ